VLRVAPMILLINRQASLPLSWVIDGSLQATNLSAIPACKLTNSQSSRSIYLLLRS
jgi:hypothetical protein